MIVSNKSYDTINDDNNEISTIVREMPTPNTMENQTLPEVSHEPLVVSLDGTTPDVIPAFVTEELADDGTAQLQSSFLIADIDQTKPNITAFAYENITSGTGQLVTWMNPSDSVRLWFKVKGPLSPTGPEVYLRFDGIVSKSTDYAYSPIVDAQINNLVEIGINESVWFYGDVVLPADTGSNYGWGPGLINAFAPTLYQPFILFVQDFEEFYGGLNDKSSYLNMFGEVYIKSLSWYNYTYDSISPDFVPCTVAERNWAVFAEFQFWVANAPVWNIAFETYLYREIVFWPDENILVSDTNALVKLNPGTYTYDPEKNSNWMGWLLEENWVYGSSIGQTRCIYSKLQFFSGGTWDDIYDSRNSGEVLHLVENIMEQPPRVEIMNPMDGEVVEQSTTTLRAVVSDPNGNTQISDLVLYVNDLGTSIFSYYNSISGLVEYEADIPQDSGDVNITLQATDSTGLKGSSTILIISDSPLNYFPSSYTSSFIHYVKTLSSQVFDWEYPLNYNTGSDLNISLTPYVELGFDISLSFDIYQSTPAQTYAGEEFTTYVTVSDPSIDFSMWFNVGVDYDIYALTAHMQGTLNLIDESWSATQDIPLGVEILDLRYDLPGLSEIVKRFSHFQIGFLDYFPVIGEFANLDLIIDVIPLLKISNVLTATLSGINCGLEKNSIKFVSDKMFALAGTINSDASGGTAQVLLEDVALESSVGLELWANFTLNGGVLGYTLANIDMNQWLYDNLGIEVPHLCLWNSKSSLSIASQIALGVDVAEQQLDIEMIQLSANEDQINVTLLIEDEVKNDIESVLVEGTIGAEDCTVVEDGSGEYTIQIPYRVTEFEILVTVSKSGYIGTSQTYTIYIDPLTVDSTPPSIQDVSVNPETPSPSDQVTVSASITDDLTAIVNPVLHYSIDDGHSWDTVDMTYKSGSNYEAMIPSFSADTEVLYFISVSDEANNEISSSQYTYKVTNPATTSTTTTTQTSTSTTTTGGTTDTGTSSTDETPNLPENPMGIIVLGIGVAGVTGVLLVLLILKKKSHSNT